MSELITFSDKKMTNLTFPFFPDEMELNALRQGTIGTETSKVRATHPLSGKLDRLDITRRVKEKEKGAIGLLRDWK